VYSEGLKAAVSQVLDGRVGDYRRGSPRYSYNAAEATQDALKHKLFDEVWRNVHQQRVLRRRPAAKVDAQLHAHSVNQCSSTDGECHISILIALLVQKLTESRFVIQKSKSGNRDTCFHVCGNQLYHSILGYLNTTRITQESNDGGRRSLGRSVPAETVPTSLIAAIIWSGQPINILDTVFMGNGWQWQSSSKQPRELRRRYSWASISVMLLLRATASGHRTLSTVQYLGLQVHSETLNTNTEYDNNSITIWNITNKKPKNAQSGFPLCMWGVIPNSNRSEFAYCGVTTREGP
jgi:hypothetical protein